MVFLLACGAPAARAEEPVWADARVSTVAQLFAQGLVPGQPGALTRVEPAFPFTTSAFVRFGAVDLPGAADTVSGELAAWGRVGARDGLLGDGDVTAAWAQYRSRGFRARLGRQVVLPGSSRYVRFDGVALGATVGAVEADVYGGWVALPRWNLPPGARWLGFIGDALEDPRLLEQQNRAGQVTVGARLGASFPGLGRLAVSFHEQRDAVGLAFRVFSADARVAPLPWLQLGGRASFDAAALGVPEARVFADVTAVRAMPLAVDYVYQAPALLLPRSSVLAAFGGAAWHELGAETRVQLPGALTLTLRGAGQSFEGGHLGGRGTVRALWTPGLDRRVLLLGEVSRASVPPAGFTQARLGLRWNATGALTPSADAAVYVYDVEVRGQRVSVTGLASLEWRASPWVRALVSATVLVTPYAAFEAQGVARLVVELDPVSAGDGS